MCTIPSHGWFMALFYPNYIHIPMTIPWLVINYIYHIPLISHSYTMNVPLTISIPLVYHLYTISSIGIIING